MVLFFQPGSIRVMGDKATARETMKKAGVPTVPGSEGLLQVMEHTFIRIYCVISKIAYPYVLLNELG